MIRVLKRRGCQYRRKAELPILTVFLLEGRSTPRDSEREVYPSYKESQNRKASKIKELAI